MKIFKSLFLILLFVTLSINCSQELPQLQQSYKLALFCLGCIQRQIKMTDAEIDAMPKWDFRLESADMNYLKKRWQQEDQYYIQFIGQFNLQTTTNKYGTPIFRPYNKNTLQQVSAFVNQTRAYLEHIETRAL